MKILSSGLATLSLLFGCSFALAQDEGADVSDPAGDVCVYTRRIDNFDGIDDEHLFVEERGNDYYLFTMRRRCSGLRFANGIGIKGTTSRVCGDGLSDVVYRAAGNRIETCGIDDIETVESKEHAEALVEERTPKDE